jgi:hypothetical protein
MRDKNDIPLVESYVKLVCATKIVLYFLAVFEPFVRW